MSATVVESFSIWSNNHRNRCRITNLMSAKMEQLVLYGYKLKGFNAVWPRLFKALMMMELVCGESFRR